MSARGVAFVVVGGIGIAVLAGVVVLGFVGVSRTVSAGTQVQLCGSTIGISVQGDTVRLLGVDKKPLAPGERARVHALCVVEVVGIDGSGGGSAAHGAEPDGAVAEVRLRWRLW